MIIGIGTDLCDIRRIEQTLERFGERFIQRCYAESEQVKAARRPNPAAAFAQRYAAKEAYSKALGTGFRDGVFWRDMVVDNLPSGKPVLTLHGGALARLNQLLPANMKAKIDLSLTDEYPMAHAMVIISAEPDGGG